MMYVISGAVIIATNERKFSFFQKCDSCGFVFKNVRRTEAVVRGNTEAHKGRFKCQKCGADNEVVIGSTKDAPASKAARAERSVASSVSSEVARDQRPLLLFRFIGWVVRTAFKLAIFAIVIGAAAYFLNERYHFLSASQVQSVKTAIDGATLR